ncbi:acetylserotonin O-methyltransferase [Desulfosarcina sp. OttesenSCG-928-A07]|nr:acetylserotonin O-methyltransferase [Desulfosarcina sp. OttesenSCG-928-G17]MDL2328610.1 acetylserotonin O-methyltransferase [Desulfosarcina sp. OttesenSCG-928-A07]
MSSEKWSSARILRMSGNYWATCVLHTAVELDLFTRIGQGRVDGPALARQINAPEDGMIRLLDAVVAMGLLNKDRYGYTNTEAASTWLDARSPHYLGFIIQHHHHLMPLWARLPDTLRSGKPGADPDRKRGPKERQAFLMGMFNLAMELAPAIVPAVDLSACKTLLDLGGGPGTYAIEFCRHYPNLTATVMDLSTTRLFAEETIRRMGMADRITFVDGNFLTEEIPGKFDAVWMSHILHGDSPEDCHKIVKKAAGCLNPGGMAVIHEFVLADTLDRPLFPALFSLNMLLMTQGGRSYSESQLAAMLTDAGLYDVGRIPCPESENTGLVKGVKPA